MKRPIDVARQLTDRRVESKLTWKFAVKSICVKTEEETEFSLEWFVSDLFMSKPKNKSQAEPVKFPICHCETSNLKEKSQCWNWTRKIEINLSFDTELFLFKKLVKLKGDLHYLAAMSTNFKLWRTFLPFVNVFGRKKLVKLKWNLHCCLNVNNFDAFFRLSFLEIFWSNENSSNWSVLCTA